MATYIDLEFRRDALDDATNEVGVMEEKIETLESRLEDGDLSSDIRRRLEDSLDEARERLEEATMRLNYVKSDAWCEHAAEQVDYLMDEMVGAVEHRELLFGEERLHALRVVGGEFSDVKEMAEWVGRVMADRLAVFRDDVGYAFDRSVANVKQEILRALCAI